MGKGGGGFVGTIIPIVASFIPGLQPFVPIIAAASGAAGAAIDGGDIGDVLLAGAISGGTSFLGSSIGGMVDSSFANSALGGAAGDLGETLATKAATAGSLFGQPITYGAMAGGATSALAGSALSGLTSGMGGYDPQQNYGYQPQTYNVGKSNQLSSEAFNEAINGASNRAINRSEQYLLNRGLTPTDYTDVVRQSIMDQKARIPTNAQDNFDAYFTDNALESALNTEQDAKRKQYRSTVDSLFGSSNIDTALTADDRSASIVDQLLGKQYGQATQGLDRARGSGQLSDTGYNAAVGELNRQKSTGLGQLNTIAGSVLDRYRSELGGIGNQAKTSADTFQLGSTFDPNAFQSTFNNKAGALNSAFENDFMSAAPKSMFDVNQLISFGGAQQGAQNMGLLAAMKDQEKKRATERGLGSQGVF